MWCDVCGRRGWCDCCCDVIPSPSWAARSPLAIEPPPFRLSPEQEQLLDRLDEEWRLTRCGAAVSSRGS